MGEIFIYLHVIIQKCWGFFLNKLLVLHSNENISLFDKCLKIEIVSCDQMHNEHRVNIYLFVCLGAGSGDCVNELFF